MSHSSMTRIVYIFKKAHYDANRFTRFNTYFDRFELNHIALTSIIIRKGVYSLGSNYIIKQPLTAVSETG